MPVVVRVARGAVHLMLPAEAARVAAKVTALRALASRHAGEAERRAVLARGLGDPDGYVAGYARQALLGPKRI